MLDAYAEGTIDRLFFIFNEFVNSMTQRPVVEQLLPRPPSEEDEVKHYWDYLYEPDARDVLDRLLTRYVESLVYQGVVENIASEQAARMVAMKAATDNAARPHRRSCSSSTTRPGRHPSRRSCPKSSAAPRRCSINDGTGDTEIDETKDDYST